MRSIILLSAVLGILGGFSPSMSYAASGDMDLVSQPICFNIRNTASYTVMGSIITDYYPDPKGVEARHRSDFRFGKAGAKDDEGNYIDRAEFCTYGPFYPGRQLELVLRTIFPIFTCKTRVDAGDILIKGTRTPDGSTKTEATCYK